VQRKPHGEITRALVESVTPTFADAHPHDHRSLVAGSGHLIQCEVPVHVHAMIARFLRVITSSGSGE
jgi:hypothetical protein